MPTRVPGQQPAQGVVSGAEHRLRDAARWRHAHAVAVSRHVLGGAATLPRDSHLDGPPVRCQAPSHSDATRHRTSGSAPRTWSRTLGGQVAEATQQVVHLVGRSGRSLGRQRLELQLELGEGVRVEQLPQLGPQQLPQQVPVERQRLRAAVGERRIASYMYDAM